MDAIYIEAVYQRWRAIRLRAGEYLPDTWHLRARFAVTYPVQAMARQRHG